MVGILCFIGAFILGYALGKTPRSPATLPFEPFPHVKFDRNGRSYVESSDILNSEGYRRQAEAARRVMDKQREARA